MRPRSDSNGSVICSTNVGANGSFAELLNAHEQARASGRPLLTEAGIGYIRQRFPRIDKSHDRALSWAAYSEAAHELPLPSWDSESRRLWLGNRLLKQFRQPAPHQTTLLDVFEEQGWIAHIDDPLSVDEDESEQDAKRRLHETLKNLNRTIPPGTIRFRGDGTGQGIHWEYDHDHAARP
jgi:hypothetical protein